MGVLRTISDESVHCVVTSPPYFGLRDYGHGGQIGNEPTPEEFVQRLVQVFAECRRVLRPDGTLWVNIGDSYSGSRSRGNKVCSNGQFNENRQSRPVITLPKSVGCKPKDLIGIPWTLALALRQDGWHLRSEIIWHKPNPMPESVTDRPTRAHEQIFLFSKSAKYHYDSDAIREANATKPHAHGASKQKSQVALIRNAASDASRQPDRIWAANGGRNKRSVWTCPVSSYKGAHFATFPEKLIEPCVLAGCPPGGIVLDPFSGAATTGLVALKNGRRYLGIELNAEYCEIGRHRLAPLSSAGVAPAMAKAA